MLRILEKHKISPAPTVIFGFDNDNPETIAATVDFAIQTKILTLFSILTPLPGTDLYKEFEKEGGIAFRNV